MKNKVMQVAAATFFTSTVGLAAHDVLETGTPKPIVQKVETCQCLNHEIVSAKISRVVDGDTLELADGNKIRLKGIDTPESTRKVEPFGLEATAETRRLLEGQWVDFQVVDREICDRFGRMLRLVFFENADGKKVSFQRHMLENGWARVSLDDDSSLKEEFCLLEREAKSKKLGIWSTAESRRAIKAKSEGKEKFTCRQDG